MKRLIIVASVVAMSFLSFSMAFAEGADSKAKPAPDRTKIRAKLQQKIEARKKQIEAEGGLIQSVAKGNVIAVLSSQKTLDRQAIERCANSIPEKMRYPIEFKEVDKVTVELIANPKYGVVIYIGEFAGNQMLLVNPDRPMAMVDVKALSSDGANAETVELRVSKMIVRAVALSLGTGTAYLGRLGGLKDLDAMDSIRLPGEAHNAVSDTARKCGIQPIIFVTYKAACEEGWAPAPTTDIQKAVLAQVKAEQSNQPKKGIKIEYDPKSGK